MKNIYPLLVVIALLALVFSCTYENREDLMNGEGGELLPDTISFSTDIQPLLATYCNQSGCHASGTGPNRGDFSTYGGVKSKVDNGSLEREVVVDRTMPKNRTMSEAEIQLFKKWIDQGALNN